MKGWNLSMRTPNRRTAFKHADTRRMMGDVVKVAFVMGAFEVWSKAAHP